MCLTEKQASYVYKKVEEGSIINTQTMKCEIEQEIDREDDNPYKRVISNKVYKDEDRTMQMEIGPFLVTTLDMCSMMKRPNQN